MGGSLKNKVGFWAGLCLFAALLILPPMPGLQAPAQRAAAVAVLMAVWWATEAVELGIVSVLPLALYPFLSVLSMEETARRYADPNIYLFLGGFLLALAMQKCGLERRIALRAVNFTGQRPRSILAGFMLATALLSLVVSNTAAALMILPIAQAVLHRMDAVEKREHFGAVLMLGIAYASSIGGVATLIGKPTNMIFVGQAKNLLPDLPEVSFEQWSLFGFPTAIGFLLIAWLTLAFGSLRRNAENPALKNILSSEAAQLGRLSSAEIRVGAIFIFTVAAWIFRPGWTALLGLRGIHDGTVAIAAAVALFVVPERNAAGPKLLDWEWAKRLPWDVLLLLGGGFALAESFHSTGLAHWAAGKFEMLRGVPETPLIFAVCLASTFLSEFMSNTALVALLMPVLASASGTLGVHPYLLMVPATVAASFSFMMPVGTPPNAIVFGTGRVRMAEMIRTGFVLNILGSLWIVWMVSWLLKPVFGIGAAQL